jgi:hypothetical protein
MPCAKCSVVAGVLGILMTFCASAGAETVSVRATDRAGEKLPGILVVLKSLEDVPWGVSRALTGPNGLVPAVDVPPGLYEAIATDPYGIFETTVKDFMVATKPVKLELQLDVVQDQTVTANAIDWHLRVVDNQNRPVVNAWVTARDSEASTGVGVTTTDSHGRATVTIPIDRAVVITVFYDGQSYSEDFDTHSGVRDCEWRCYLRARAKLKKRPRSLTLAVP